MIKISYGANHTKISQLIKKLFKILGVPWQKIMHTCSHGIQSCVHIHMYVMPWQTIMYTTYFQLILRQATHIESIQQVTMIIPR
jgi:hypothetical protein